MDEIQYDAEQMNQIARIAQLLSEGDDGIFDPVRWVENVHVPALRITGPPHAARIVEEAISKLRSALEAAERERDAAVDMAAAALWLSCDDELEEGRGPEYMVRVVEMTAKDKPADLPECRAAVLAALARRGGEGGGE
jgi:CRP-like cAMP-binding protein